MATFAPQPLPRQPDARKATPRRPLIIRYGKKLRRSFDALIAHSSRVPNDPVLDAADFPWTAELRGNWQAIRDEALAVLADPQAIPLLDEVSPDHKRIAPAGKWRSFFLRGYGYDVAENMARCPRTTALVRGIPRLNSAFFSILAPGTHIPAHRGVTKALMTCHLGLLVPEGPVRMRVGDRMVGWANGETLVFDDTYQHEVWNETDETRVVLLIQFGRPLAAPGRWLAEAFLWGIRHTAFVREAHANIASWDKSMRDVEATHGLD